MIKQNKKNIGIILITFLLPMLACNMPVSFYRLVSKAFDIRDVAEEKRDLKDEFDAIVVPDNYDLLPSEQDQAVFPTNYSCTINTGSYYDLYVGYNPDSISNVEFSEIEFYLENFYPGGLTYNFEFYGKAIIPLIDTDGNIYGYPQYEDIEEGEGYAIWEDSYFYGEMIVERRSITTYNGETSQHTTFFDLGGFGALTPNREEIHLCTDNITKDLFDSLKLQPFDQLRAACISNNYFICTPE